MVTEYVKYTDAQLAQATHDDPHAFDELVRRHLAPLYAFVRRLVGGDGADAEDIAQEAFVKAYTAIGRYDPTKPFRTWLYAIARNSAIDWLRRNRTTAFSRLEDGPDDSFAADIPDDQPLPDELFARVELAAELEGALATLAEVDRTILLLRYTEGFSLEDIARTLDVPAGTVRSRHHRALACLRKLLELQRRAPDGRTTH